MPILMEIPFDRKIAEAYSRGEMLVDVMPVWKEKFLNLHHGIEEIISQTPTRNNPQESRKRDVL
jgi:MinD superfamily P-loop ATPase